MAIVARKEGSKNIKQKKKDKLVFFIRAYPPLDLGFIKMPKVVPKITPQKGDNLTI
jgi:hypothetical protein